MKNFTDEECFALICYAIQHTDYNSDVKKQIYEWFGQEPITEAEIKRILGASEAEQKEKYGRIIQFPTKKDLPR